jgi:hypothetical protein
MSDSTSSSPEDDHQLLRQLLDAKTKVDVQRLLANPSIVDESAYTWSISDPASGWQPGRLHWIPVGRDRGNAGRINLAGEPYNPHAERLINGMEALIELARQRELQRDPNAVMPQSPRDAVDRYFGLPRLDSIPRISDIAARKTLEERLRETRRELVLRVEFAKALDEFSVEIRDHGIGQSPEKVHETLLSLGQTDKADKPYLIGVFGQGGSSAYAASTYSLIVSRRAPECLDGKKDRIGWTIVKKVIPKGRRDPYYAYLATLPDGRVPSLDPGEDSAFPHGTLFRHSGYDFGRQGSAVARTLYYALNHVLFNPVLPYDLYAMKAQPDPMYGTAYRLARLAKQLESQGEKYLYKPFQAQPVGAASEEVTE